MNGEMANPGTFTVTSAIVQFIARTTTVLASAMESPMLLKMSDWDRIRLNFTDEEKAHLNAAISGETICPRGCIVDESKAVEECEKVRSLINNAAYQNMKATIKQP